MGVDSVGCASVVSCMVRRSGVIVVTFIIVITGVIVSWNDVVISLVDEAYYAAVVEMIAVIKLRRLRSCMIRINTIQKKVGTKDKSSNYSKDKWLDVRIDNVRIRGYEQGKIASHSLFELSRR